MEFGRDDIYYAYLKNTGRLSNECEDHLHVFSLTCFSRASHAVVGINNFTRVLETCDRSHALVVEAVLERDEPSGPELLRPFIVLSRLGYPQRPSVIEVGCFILIGPGIECRVPNDLGTPFWIVLEVTLGLKLQVSAVEYGRNRPCSDFLRHAVLVVEGHRYTPLPD